MSTVLMGKSTLVKIPLILAHGQSTNFKPFVAHLTSTQCFELFMGQQYFSEPLSHAFALTLTLANSLRTYNALDPLLPGLTFLLSALSTNTNGYQGLDNPWPQCRLSLHIGTPPRNSPCYLTLKGHFISLLSYILNVYIKKTYKIKLYLVCLEDHFRREQFHFHPLPCVFFFPLKKKETDCNKKAHSLYHESVIMPPSPHMPFPTNG